MGRATASCCGMGVAYGRTTVGSAVAPRAYCRWPASTIGGIEPVINFDTPGRN